jgi:ATP-dependent Clp protease ATP-binding subunit ClpC
MYERFTDRARRVMQLANQEAQRFNQQYLGTEHVLLGLAKEGSGVAANVLKAQGIDLRALRVEVERLTPTVPDTVTMGKLPHSPRAKRVVELAMEEARALGHNYVGTEHLLLGLVRLSESGAGQALANLGMTPERVRAGVLEIIGHADPGGGGSVFAFPRITPRPSLPQRLGRACRAFWQN